jgi:propanol-preferring alcohol dehydrogenase
VKAALLTAPAPIARHPLQITEVPRPEITAGHVLLRVRACGICRTDLHLVEGDLPLRGTSVIPGHQIVGEVVDGATATLPLGTRVGVSWVGGVDGDCWYCTHDAENLCDSPTFTGYTVDGGYAEYTLARRDFVFALPTALGDLQAAPLLCAGIIGFRSLRVGVLHAWGCAVYVSTRGAAHRQLASALGAVWVGTEHERPPVPLDRAITFAPSGDVVVAALASLRKGGVVAINAIHLDRIPEFDYDRLLWGERQIRSVANMTRADARDFLRIAVESRLAPRVTVFPLEQANQALAVLKNDGIEGAAVIVP